MTSDKFGALKTGTPSAAGLLHDAARPFAAVEFRRDGTVRRVIGRYMTMHGAAVAAGRAKKREG